MVDTGREGPDGGLADASDPVRLARLEADRDALQARNERLERRLTLLEETARLTGAGGWEYDVRTGRVTWTDELYRLHDLPVDPTVDHLDASLRCYPPEDRAVVERAFRKAVETGESYDLELRFITAKGRQRWVRTTARAIVENGRVERVVGNLIDVTDLFRAAELERKDAMLDAVSRSAESLLRAARWQDVIDPVLGELCRAARADRISFFRQWRDAEGELVASLVAEWSWPELAAPALKAVLHEFRPLQSPMADWARSYERGESTHALVRDRPEVERRFFESLGIRAVAGMPVMVEGRPWGVLSFNMCEAEMLWSPAEFEFMKIAAGSLGAVIGRQELATRFRAQEADLIQAGKLSTFGAITAGLGHEISQPLTALSNRVEATRLALRRREPDRAELETGLETIASLAEHLAGIVQRIRAFARRGEMVRAPVAINEIIRETVVFFREQLGRDDLRVELVLEHELPPVPADELQLRQVLTNLLLNACEAVASLPPVERRLSITTRRAESGSVQIVVCDNGRDACDVDPEALFAPFYTTKQDGLGLGLAISRTLVEAHGGSLRARRRVEGGLAFELELPGAERPRGADSGE